MLCRNCIDNFSFSDTYSALAYASAYIHTSSPWLVYPCHNQNVLYDGSNQLGIQLSQNNLLLHVHISRSACKLVAPPSFEFAYHDNQRQLLYFLVVMIKH